MPPRKEGDGARPEQRSRECHSTGGALPRTEETGGDARAGAHTAPRMVTSRRGVREDSNRVLFMFVLSQRPGAGETMLLSQGWALSH